MPPMLSFISSFLITKCNNNVGTSRETWKTSPGMPKLTVTELIIRNITKIFARGFEQFPVFISISRPPSVFCRHVILWHYKSAVATYENNQTNSTSAQVWRILSTEKCYCTMLLNRCVWLDWIITRLYANTEKINSDVTSPPEGVLL